LLVTALLLPGQAAYPADKETDPDVLCLKHANLATDDASLLGYVRDRAKLATDPAELPALIHQLGSSDFAQREEASGRLVALGERAVSLLRQNLNHEDAEIASRARACLERIEKNGQAYLAPAVVRLLGRRQPPGTLETLLAYLPVAADPEAEADIYFALDALGTRDGQPSSGLVAALGDKHPARRAVAACIVGRAGTAEQKEAVRKLLADKDPAVRLRAAQGLLAGHEAAGIPVLLRLLEEGSLELAWQAEELLHWVAGDEAPEQVLGAGSAEQRRACLAAWEKWTQKNSSLDWAALEQAPRRPGLLAVEEGLPVPGKHSYDKDGLDIRLRLYGCDGRLRHEFKAPEEMTVWRWLPEGRLITSSLPGEVKELWTEQDASGRALWETTFPPPWPRWTDLKRLPSGDVVAFSPKATLILDTRGQEVRRVRVVSGLVHDRASLQLPWPRSGLLWEAAVGEREERLVLHDYDLQTGESLRRLPLGAAIPQDASLLLVADAGGGSLLLACAAPAVNEAEHYQLLELDGASRVQRRTVLPGTIRVLQRLHNGRTVVGGQSGYGWGDHPLGWLGELDGDGRLVWEIASLNHVVRVQEVAPVVRLGWTWPRQGGADFNGPAYRLRQLQSKSLPERRCAAHRLKALKLNDAELRQAMESLADPDEEVRQALLDIALAAGKRVEREAVPSLIAMLKTHQHREFEYSAGCVLQNIGPAAIPPLIQLVEDQKQPAQARAWAVFALAGWLEDSRAAAVLRKSFHHTDPTIRKFALDGVCRRQEAARQWLPELVAMLESDDLESARTVASSFANLGPGVEEALPGILKALNKKELQGNLLDSLRFIGRTGPETLRKNVAVPGVLIRLLDKKEEVTTRSGAAALLGCLGSAAKKAVPALIEILQEKPTRTPGCTLQDMVATSLGAIGPPAKAAVPALLTIVKQQALDAETRQAAIVALGQIGSEAKEAIPALLAIVQEGALYTDPLVSPAMTALAGIDPKAGQEAARVWKAKFDKQYLSGPTVPPSPGIHSPR
jgi:HEAT repeat protein